MIVSQQDTISAYKVSTGVYISHPGTSTVDYARDLDTESLEDFRLSQHTASINAFICQDFIPTLFPLCAAFVFFKHRCTQLGVGFPQ